MSPRPARHRRSRRAFTARMAVVAIVLCGGTLIAAQAARNTVDGSNLDHITNLPGPPPQTTETPSSPAVTDPASSTSSPTSDPSMSSEPPPSDPAPSSTG